MDTTKDLLMDPEQIKALEDAIDKRVSVRKYHETPLEEGVLDKLSAFIRHLQVPFEHDVHLELVKSNNFYYFKEPQDTCLIGIPNRGFDHQAAAGFVGELFILYAVSLGLSTCWYGHYKHKGVDAVKEQLGMGYDVISITPIGYQEHGFQLSEKIFSNRRRPAHKNLTKDSLSEFPDYIWEGLTAAGKAPSAMNSQCWNFKVTKSEDYWTVEIFKPMEYTHFKWDYPDVDVGTAAAHFWLSVCRSGHEPIVRLGSNEWHGKWTFMLPFV